MTDLDVEYQLTVTPEQLAIGAKIPFSWQDGKNAQTIEVKLPTGGPPGTLLRIRGFGRSGSSGQIGDLYLLLNVQAGKGSQSEDGRLIFLAGLALVALGLTLITWTEYSALNEGTYRFNMPLLGPITAFIGFILVHWPKLRLEGFALVGFYLLYRWIIPLPPN